MNMPENPRKSRECPRKFLENPMNPRISMQKTSEQSHFYLPKNAGRPAGKASTSSSRPTMLAVVVELQWAS